MVLKPESYRINLAVDVPHNYAEIYTSGEVIHRKGAVSAQVGEKGVIPGSMGSSSFITKGLGNPDSIFSSSHGAGRTMGRNQAKRTYTMDEFETALEGTFSQAREGILDESPMAYKAIDHVINRQLDCIAVTTVLRPLLTIKGGGRDEG